MLKQRNRESWEAVMTSNIKVGTTQPTQPEQAKLQKLEKQPDLSTEGALKERGGPKGPEPTRYGDWENNGRCTDF